jgi:hypothetical protein
VKLVAFLLCISTALAGELESLEQRKRAVFAEWMRSEADVKAALVEGKLTPEQAHTRLTRKADETRERLRHLDEKIGRLK